MFRKFRREEIKYTVFITKSIKVRNGSYTSTNIRADNMLLIKALKRITNQTLRDKHDIEATHGD